MPAMPEPSVEETPVETAPAPSGRGQKLWAVLLVLDSFFVITFGGTLAMKLYQHWQAPPPVVPSRAHRPPKAAPAAASTAAAATAPVPAAPAAPAKAEAAKPAAKPEPPSNGLRPPKPSMLQEAPRHEKAGLQGAASGAAPAAPAAPAAGAKNKALPTEFTLKAPGARSVELVGAFIVHGGRKAMVSHPDGTWTLTLYLTPNTYRYWFVVNGKKTLDPSSARVDRGASVVTVGQ
jgi:hypothetical protein